MLSWSASDLAIDLVVEVFRQNGLRIRFCDVPCGSYKLLKLNTCDEVLVLWGHQTVSLGKQEYLVIPLSTFGIFGHIGRTLLLREIHKRL